MKSNDSFESLQSLLVSGSFTSDIAVNGFDAGIVSDSLADDAYIAWNNQAISGSSNSASDDDSNEDNKYVPYLPIGQAGQGDVTDYSQSDVQSGSAVLGDSTTIESDEVVTLDLSTLSDQLQDSITAQYSILDWVKYIWNSLVEGFNNIKTWIGDCVASVGTFIADATAQIGEWWDAGTTAITTAISDAIAAVLAGIQAIFVPSTDYLTVKVEALRVRFDFVNSIILTGEAVGGAFTGFYTEPPIIYAELANAENSYYWGERAIILDLRWYGRYKPTVDAIISSFLWLIFAWSVFRKVPNIISGIGGTVSKMTGSHLWDGDMK